MGEGTARSRRSWSRSTTQNTKKDIEALDIELPVLTPRIYREYKNLDVLDVAAMHAPRVRLPAIHARSSSARSSSATSTPGASATPPGSDTTSPTDLPERDRLLRSDQSAARPPAGRRARRAVRQAQGSSSQDELSTQPVDLDDSNTLRNLSELDATQTLLETFKTAINALTVGDRGTSADPGHDQAEQDAAVPRQPAALRRGDEIDLQQDCGRQRLRVGVRSLPRPLRRYRLVRQELTEHRISDRVPERRGQHRQLLPGLHRQADVGRSLDYRD